MPHRFGKRGGGREPNSIEVMFTLSNITIKKEERDFFNMSATPGYLQLFQMQIIHLNSLNFILQTQGPTVQIWVFAWSEI